MSNTKLGLTHGGIKQYHDASDSIVCFGHKPTKNIGARVNISICVDGEGVIITIDAETAKRLAADLIRLTDFAEKGDFV